MSTPVFAMDRSDFSQKEFFDLNLGEVWRYRDLLFLLVKRDFTAQYRQTILGPLWHIIQPVFTTIMFIILFGKIASLPTDNLPHTLFYMSSITIWNFFTASLNSTASTFTNNAGIFGKVYFPRLIMPLSTVLSGIARFGIQFCLLIGFIIYFAATGNYHFHFGWHNLLLPLIVVLMALIGLGLGIIISSLTTKYRDLNILIGFGVSLLMYITPVAYPLSFLQHSSFKGIIIWNPLSSLVEGFRYSLFGEGIFDIRQFVYSLLFAIACLTVGIFLFSKVEKNFMDTV